mgnify:CR=1 FL=1
MAGSFFQRLKDGLTKSRDAWAQKIGSLFETNQWTEQTMESVEETLLKADVGVKATHKLMEDEPHRTWCVSVFKDNAGIVRFDETSDVCIKVETHNHPTAIAPFPGAALACLSS